MYGNTLHCKVHVWSFCMYINWSMLTALTWGCMNERRFDAGSRSPTDSIGANHEGWKTMLGEDWVRDLETRSEALGNVLDHVTISPESIQRHAELIKLGQGYDSMTGGTRPERCVRGAYWAGGRTSSTFRFDYANSQSDFLRQTKGSASAGVNLGLIGGKGTIEFETKVEETSLSTALTFSYVIDQGRVVLWEREVTPVARQVAKLGAYEIRKVCGDSFLYAADLGAKLYLSIVFRFKDSETYKKFKTKIQISALFGAIKKTKTFTEESRDFHDSAYVQIAAHQRGGAPEVLQHILGGSGVDSTQCKLSNIDPCMALFNDLLAYVKGQGGFIDQIKGRIANGTLQGLAVTSTEPSSYLSGAHFLLVSEEVNSWTDSEATMARVEALFEKLRELRNKEARAESLLASDQPEDKKSVWRPIMDVIKRNISRYRDALNTCQSSVLAKTCEQSVDQADRAQEPIATSALNY